MLNIVETYGDSVLLIKLPGFLLLFYLLLHLVLTFIHAYQELRGKQWDYLGNIAGVRIPEIFGILLFFVGLTLLLWTVGLVGVIGYLPWMGAVPTAVGITAVGMLIGGRLSDRLYNHVKPDKQGFRPNPGLSSTPYYLAEAILLFVLFLPGIMSHLLWAVIGFAIGWGFFYGVLPIMRWLRRFPQLRAVGQY